jgi:hypothetical protein
MRICEFVHVAYRDDFVRHSKECNAHIDTSMTQNPTSPLLVSLFGRSFRKEKRRHDLNNYLDPFDLIDYEKQLMLLKFSSISNWISD